MEYLFPDQKTKLRLIIKIKKSITKFELKPDGPGFADALLSASLYNVRKNCNGRHKLNIKTKKIIILNEKNNSCSRCDRKSRW